MTPGDSYPDESSRAVSVDIPTTVPSSFYAQAQGDMLSQRVQSDAADMNFRLQTLSDHADLIGQLNSVRQLDQQMQPVRNANQHIGSTAWGSGHNTYCETFAEQMTDGKNMGASAYDAFGNRLKAGQAVADPTLQGAQPGDLVYFGRAGENGGFGHVGVYTGDGRITSATVNGIQNYPISTFSAPVVGYARTGTGEAATGGDSGFTGGSLPHEGKEEGGDNAPPPQVSGDGSWAPPSADAFKDWLGSQISKAFSTPADAGSIAGQQMSDLGSAAHGLADQAQQSGLGQALSAPAKVGNDSASGAMGDSGFQPGAAGGIEPLQQAVKSGVGSVLGGALDVGLAQAPLTDQERSSVRDAVTGGAGSFVQQGLNQAQQNLSDLEGGDPSKGAAAADNILLSTLGSKGSGIEDLGSNLNPDHLPGDVMPALDSTYKANAGAIDTARRGVISDSAAKDLAQVTGQSVDDIVAKWKPGDAANEETMIALRNAMVDRTRAAQAARDAWQANPTPDNNMARMTADAAATNMQTVVQGLTAEAGRALRAIGIDVTDPLVLAKLADNPDFVSSIRNAEPGGSLPSAIGGQGGKKFAPDVYRPTGAVTEAAPVQQEMLPGLEPPALGQNTVQAAAKPFTAEAGSTASDLTSDVKYPVFQGSPIDTGPSGMGLNVPWLKGLQKAQDMAKQVLVSLSVFHPFVEEAQLGRTFLGQGKPIQGLAAMTNAAHAAVSPSFTDAYLQANRFAAQRAEAAGATLLRGDVTPDIERLAPRLIQSALGAAGSGVSGYAEAKATGASDDDARNRALALGAFGAASGLLAPTVSRALWQRLVPVAKLEAFKVLENKYGAEAAATTANNTFGGQNLAKLGRTQQVQDVARMALLAPDWLESWARNAGAPLGIGVEHGITGPEAQAARAYWAGTLIAGAVTLEGLNVAFNGHTTDGNEPGHRFELETTGIFKKLGRTPAQRTYLDINSLGPFGSALEALDRGVGRGDPLGTVGAFANSHLNIGPSSALGLVKNIDYSTGKQIVPQGTPAQDALLREVGSVGKRVTPIGAGAFRDENVPVEQQLLSALLGMRSSAGNAGGYHAFKPGANSGYRPFVPSNNSGYRAFKPA